MAYGLSACRGLGSVVVGIEAAAITRIGLDQLRAGVDARVRQCSYRPRSPLFPRTHPRGCRRRYRGSDQLRGQLRQSHALTRWDPQKYKRVHAPTYADLGDSLAAQARAGKAAAAWAQAVALMEGMASDRTRKAITSLRSTLAVHQGRKVPGAAELAHRARQALA